MKKYFSMLCFGFICSILFACNSASNIKPNIANGSPSIQVDAMQVPGGWGYTIVVDGKPFIRQDYIPAISGNKAFKTKADAEKTGLWVANKMKKNERINVTAEVLEQLGIKNN